MILKSLAFFVTAFLSSVASHGQTENSVKVVPHWKNDEAHSVKIRSIATNNHNGKTSSYLSSFDARFIVKEVSGDGYKVEWSYTGANLADNEPLVENQILSKLANKKLLIKLSEVGRFVELLNADEVRSDANKIIDELIAGSAANSAMNAQYKATKNLIASKQGLEIALLKHIKLYNFSFGHIYKLNDVQTNNIKFPNPFGGQPFDATEKVQLTKLDAQNSVCVIETSKIIDGQLLKTSAIDYIKKASNSNPQALEEMSKASLELTESTTQQIDFSKGLLQKSSFQRIMNLGFQSQTITLEVETAD